MRPVEKKRPGELIGYTDSNMQKVEHRIKGHYPDYGDAKFPLSANIGAFCSYCEGCEKIPALDVEHLAAKAKAGMRQLGTISCCAAKSATAVKARKQLLPIVTGLI